MADPIDFTPILAQLSGDVLIEELRRRLGLAASNGGESSGGSQTPSGGANPNRETGAPGVIRSDEFFRLSIPEAVKKYLGIMKRPQKPKSIVDGLTSGGVLSNAKNFYTLVWGELKRMEAKDTVVNTPTGWALSEWYPSKPKSLETAKPKRRRKRAKKSPGAPTASDKGTGKQTYAQFVGSRMKAGRSMKEAAAEWKQRKAGGA